MSFTGAVGFEDDGAGAFAAILTPCQLQGLCYKSGMSEQTADVPETQQQQKNRKSALTLSTISSWMEDPSLPKVFSAISLICIARERKVECIIWPRSDACKTGFGQARELFLRLPSTYKTDVAGDQDHELHQRKFVVSIHACVRQHSLGLKYRFVHVSIYMCAEGVLICLDAIACLIKCNVSGAFMLG